VPAAPAWRAVGNAGSALQLGRQVLAGGTACSHSCLQVFAAPNGSYPEYRIPTENKERFIRQTVVKTVGFN